MYNIAFLSISEDLKCMTLILLKAGQVDECFRPSQNHHTDKKAATSYWNGGGNWNTWRKPFTLAVELVNQQTIKH